MHSSFSDQLAGLDLSGFSIGPAPVSTNDFPVHDAVVQTLEAVWSDLFAMVSGTALEADAEDLGWAFVNIFHRSATRKSTAVDRATDEVRALVATADGSEIHTHELETQVERAQCAEGAMIALEEMREVAAALYLNEFGSSWKPVSSSRFNHSAMLTSALVEGREFVRARSEAKRRAKTGPDDHENAEFGRAEAYVGHLVDVMRRRPDVGVGGKEQVAEQDNQRRHERQEGRYAKGHDNQDLREKVASMVDQKAEARPLFPPVARQRAVERIAEPVQRHADEYGRQES